jgi:L-iditol 2-dehydrogenase
MKAAVLTGIRSMEIRDVPEPRLKSGADVLLKVEAVGVCGSDVHYYTQGRIGSQVVQYPFAVGHEMSATVAQIGHHVRRFKPGDRVAIDPAMPCGRCDQCRAGRPHTCRRIRFLGCPGQADGCLSERLVMPEACCFPIRAKTTFEQAAFVEPLSIGVYAVTLAGEVRGKTVAVLGTGPIGLCVTLAARARRVKTIYATDLIPERLAAAGRAGADWTGNPRREDVVAAISKRVPLLLDVVFECCGQQEALDQAVQLLKPGGRLVIVGIPETDRVSFDIDLLRRREIAILNVRRQNECVQPALDLLERGKVNVDFMVTHRVSLDRVQEAFDRVAGYRDGVIKAMVRI